MSGRPSRHPSIWRQDLSLPPKLGCPSCPDFERCGGLRISGPAIDCTSFCDCNDRDTCDRTCRLSSQFARRFHEVEGFDFLRSPGPSTTATPQLAGHAPLIYHGSRRQSCCQLPVVAIPFFALFNRLTGLPRYSSREILAETFRFDSNARIVASATAKDRPLERWWKLPRQNKVQVYENLRMLKIDLVTAPNFSVFNDVPYWDNWHNQKRIILSWTDFMMAGVPAALHVNCHTVEDYREYRRFISHREDVLSLSVEFGTGMGHPSRVDWHVSELCELAESIRRPLNIVVRGGLSMLSRLGRSYSSVLFIDTDPFVKTQKRQRAFWTNTGTLLWLPSSSATDEVLDHKFRESVEICSARMTRALAPDFSKLLRPAKHRNHKTRAVNNLKQLSLFLPHSSVHHKSKIAASKAEQRVQVIEAGE